ncbi:hypothetical protein H4S06_006423, partial [Coemansia sp. BCRC 34490]
ASTLLRWPPTIRASWAKAASMEMSRTFRHRWNGTHVPTTSRSTCRRAPQWFCATT